MAIGRHNPEQQKMWVTSINFPWAKDNPFTPGSMTFLPRMADLARS